MSWKVKRFRALENILIISLIINITSCKTYQKPNIPHQDFDKELIGIPPQYSEKLYWAEHPENNKSYAVIPKNYTDTLYQEKPNIDVFYIHPTLYTTGGKWNADIHDQKLNDKIKNTAIKYQASVFAGIANIYAPHYRQMHIHSYSDLKNGYKAYDVAYSDIKNAFLYYWKNHNNLKPFIIAGHSQGTNHAERLLKEIILPNDSIRKLLIISYLPGMPISKFKSSLPVCDYPEEIDCDILVIGGGGAGSDESWVGGGGAGGLIYYNIKMKGKYILKVGNGGIQDSIDDSNSAVGDYANIKKCGVQSEIIDEDGKILFRAIGGSMGIRDTGNSYTEVGSSGDKRITLHSGGSTGGAGYNVSLLGDLYQVGLLSEDNIVNGNNVIVIGDKSTGKNELISEIEDLTELGSNISLNSIS